MEPHVIGGAGQLEAVNAYVSMVAIRTNAPEINLNRITQGVGALSIISALELPGVLLQVTLRCFCRLHYMCFCSQVAIALGRFSNSERCLPLRKTKLIQRTIGLFFSVCRKMHLKRTTDRAVKVRHLLGNTPYLPCFYMCE